MKRTLRIFIPLIVCAVFLSAQTIFSEETGGSLPLQNLSVPEELGKIQERFISGAGRTIIQIQDVHAHPVAQENIAAILERLRTVFGIKTVAIEGAWASTSLPKSQAIPTSREKQLLASSLLSEDLITGPAYAAIMSRDPIELIGIEDASLYQKNRELFLAHLDQTKGVSDKLASYGEMMLKSEQSVWGPELLAFGTAFGKFRETSDLGRFFPILLKTAETQAVDLSDLDQLVLLRETLVLEKSFNKEKLQREISQLMRQYKGAPWTVEELIRGGKISPEKLGMYPEVIKLKKLLELRDKVSLKDLTEQIGALTNRLLGKLITAPEQDALWQKAERFYLAKKVLSLQAAPGDLEELEKERTVFEAELSAAGLANELALALEFYARVRERDQIFYDRVMTDPALSGNVAIVTGGFHTDGLSERFREAGVAFITVSPELGGVAMNEKLYIERMRVESQTLSELQNGIAQIDDHFPPALEVLFQTKNLADALRKYRGESIAVSKQDRMRGLAAAGRLRVAQGPNLVNASPLKISEFMALPRAEQRAAVQRWMEPTSGVTSKSMLVTSAGILKPMLRDPNNAKILEENLKDGDTFALLQDIPVGDTPEQLLTGRGVARFEVRDMDTLITGTARFQKLAKLHPFAIMKADYKSEKFVVLPESPVSLLLYRIITLNSSLYRAAQNPEFLNLLQSLVAEVLSQQAAQQAA